MAMGLLHCWPAATFTRPLGEITEKIIRDRRLASPAGGQAAARDAQD